LVDLATCQTPGGKQCAESSDQRTKEQAEEGGANLESGRGEFKSDPAGGEEIPESSGKERETCDTQENSQNCAQKSAEGGFHGQPKAKSRTGKAHGEQKAQFRFPLGHDPGVNHKKEKSAHPEAHESEHDRAGEDGSDRLADLYSKSGSADDLNFRDGGEGEAHISSPGSGRQAKKEGRGRAGERRSSERSQSMGPGFFGELLDGGERTED